MVSEKKRNILSDLKKVYCRIKCSPIAGVGVFAVRDIPKNTNPFPSSLQKWYQFHISDFTDIKEGVMEMIKDFFVVENDGKVLIPEHGLNGMDISFFLNNSSKPNVRTKDGFIFFTKKEIKKGEELTVSYRSYC